MKQARQPDAAAARKTLRIFFPVFLVFVFIVAAGEGLLHLFGAASAAGSLPSDVAVVPAFIDAGGFLLSLGLFFFFQARRDALMPAVSLVLSLLALCGILVCLHFQYPAIFLLFCAPVFAAAQFADNRVLTAAFLSCLVVFSIHSFWLLPAAYPAYRQPLSESVLYIFHLCGMYAGCRVLLFNMSAAVADAVNAGELSKRDPFTRLLNRSSFHHMLDRMILDNHNHNVEFSLILWDLDNFVEVNAAYDHDIGDKVLLLFVRALGERAAPSDFVFRCGGKKFAVLTPASDRAAFALAKRMRDRFFALYDDLALDFNISASAGICQYRRKAFGDSRAFYSAAAHALYVAERDVGKNASVIWHGALSERTLLSGGEFNQAGE